VLDAVPADLVVDGVNLRDAIRSGWEKPGATPASRWAAFKGTVTGAIGRAAAKGSGVSRGTRAYLEKLIPSVVFTYTYPRLDIEVSKTMNHLLKAPFCIHPKTGRVCVPIDPEKVDAFDPTAVPTVAQLTEEATLHSRAAAAGVGAGAAAGAGAGAMDEDGGSSSTGAGSGAAAIGDLWRHTSLEPYLKIFESFVQGCEAEVARKRKDDNDRTAAAFGDF
jgi:DNA primase small subunit